MKTLFVILLAVFSISAQTRADEKPLYQRLGGKPAVKSIVGDSVEKLSTDDRLMSDPDLKKLSSTINRKQMTDALTQKVCELSGGPCKKKPLKIQNAPEALNLKPMEWIYVVQDVNAVMDQHHTPMKEKTELVNLLMNAQKRAESSAQ